MASGGGGKMFWKQKSSKVPGNIKPVFGAQYPPMQPSYAMSQNKDAKPHGYKTFDDFEMETHDAWDIDVNDDELLSIGLGKVWSKDVEIATKRVLDKHRRTSAGGQQEHHTPVRGSWNSRVNDSGHPRQHHSVPQSGGEVNNSRGAQSTVRVSGGHSSNGKETVTIINRPDQSVSPTSSAGRSYDNDTIVDGSELQGVGRTHHPHHGPGLGVRQAVSSSRPTIRYGAIPIPDQEETKIRKHKQLLQQPNLDLESLRKLAWSGSCHSMRPTEWKLLLGYLPPNKDRQAETLLRKREEYFGFIDQYYNTREQDFNQTTYRQIHIDIPRTNPLVPLFQQPIVQAIFERILYIWAIRHPASGYVQGINDLVTPFFVVFLSEYSDLGVKYMNEFEVSRLSEEQVKQIEADSFWCMSKLLDGIQDNYTFAQPGIQMKVKALRELVKRVNENLHNILEKHSVEYLQFTFRWMNNLLMRELPLHCTIRLWDTYMSEPDGFATFHRYVCAAFLMLWDEDIQREKDFQGIMILLQNLPTLHWMDADIGMLVAEAYRLKCLFANAPKHLDDTS